MVGDYEPGNRDDVPVTSEVHQLILGQKLTGISAFV